MGIRKTPLEKEWAALEKTEDSRAGNNQRKDLRAVDMFLIE